MLYPPFKNLRLSVHPSVRLSVRLSVRQRFISALYLEHFLTDFGTLFSMATDSSHRVIMGKNSLAL